jgi:SAM-dependent methyltransferase
VADPYDAGRIARIFDTYGEAEWSRHEATPFARVAFHVHRHYLREFVRPGDRVLEVGAGAGRFTVELARIGATVTVTDISPGQLELNAAHTREAGVADRVVGSFLADVVDLSRFGERSFDAVVAYGGALSWVLEERDRALAELVRVTRSGGLLLFSVMSRFGSLRTFERVADEEIEEFGLDEMDAIVTTGYLPDHHSTLGPMHLYTWREVAELVERHPCDLVVASAANLLSTGDEETCRRWLDDPIVGERFLAWEVEACRQAGALDGGTHILVVVRAR